MEITVPEAAARAHRTQETIRRWIWSGRLPARKVGNQHVIEEAELERLIGSREAERWQRYFDARAAIPLSPEARAALARVDIGEWLDEDRDSH